MSKTYKDLLNDVNIQKLHLKTLYEYFNNTFIKKDKDSTLRNLILAAEDILKDTTKGESEQKKLEVSTAAGVVYPYGPKVKAKMISPFGMRIHPIHGTKKMHKGVDLVGYARELYSVVDGIVAHAGWGSGYGNTVIISSDKLKKSFLYGHLDLIDYKIKKGAVIEAGVYIGKQGNTGDSRGEHLHFEVREGTTKDYSGFFSLNPIDPKPFLDPNLLV